MDRIMVVDDDATSLAICKALLGKKYEVIGAQSGLQALGYLKKNRNPDVILMDVLMPGVSGMEMLKILKNDEKYAEIPVLFLTCTDDSQFEVEGVLNGAVDFLRKPVQPDLLKIKVARHVYFSHLIKENRQLKDRLEKIKKQVNQLCDDPLESS